MRLILPCLAAFCFALVAVGCHSHSHADGGACCGTDGECCKKKAE